MSVLDGDALTEEVHNKLSKLEEEAKERNMTLEEYNEYLERLKIISRVSAKTIGVDLVPVIPTNEPYGQVFYCDPECKIIPEFH